MRSKGLYYYGHRYYNPALGRWVNRDPIGEEGGDNLYIHLKNNSLSLIDLLGLTWKAIYRGNDYYFWYGRIPIPGQPTSRQYRGGAHFELSSYKLENPVITESSGCYCIEDGSGIADIHYAVFGVKEGAPPGYNHLQIQRSASAASHGTWHEITESRLLKKLYNRTLGEAEKRAKENLCSKGKGMSSKVELENYIKWEQASRLYFAQARQASAFDRQFGITIANGMFVPITQRSSFNESSFDRWYAPDIY